MAGVNQDLLAATMEQLTSELRNLEMRVSVVHDTYVQQHERVHARMAEWFASREVVRLQRDLVEPPRGGG